MKLRGRKAGNYRGDIPLCMSCVCVVGGGGGGPAGELIILFLLVLGVGRKSPLY